MTALRSKPLGQHARGNTNGSARLLGLEALEGAVDFGDQWVLINGAEPGLGCVKVQEGPGLLLLEQVDVVDAE